jgi:hypothetical protein
MADQALCFDLVYLGGLHRDRVELVAKVCRAYEIMTRRGWGVQKLDGAGWYAVSEHGSPVPCGIGEVLRHFPNPAEAIIAAEEWMKNQEAKDHA